MEIMEYSTKKDDTWRPFLGSMTYSETQKKLISNLNTALILMNLYFSLLDFIWHIFEKTSFIPDLMKLFDNLCAYNLVIECFFLEDSIIDILIGVNSLYL